MLIQNETLEIFFKETMTLFPDMEPNILSQIKDNKINKGNSISGIGKRVYIPIQLENGITSVFMELFSQIKMGEKPTNDLDGFTEDDCIFFTGVNINRMSNVFKDSMENIPFAIGMMIPRETFIDNFIHDSYTRVILHRTFDSLENLCDFSDDFSDHINEIWKMIELGSNEFNIIKGLC